MFQERKYHLDTLQAALRLVEFMLELTRHELGVSEISRGVGLSKSQTYRILQNLGQWDYVQQNPKTRKYRLGLKFLFAGRVVSQRLDLLQVAGPILDQLRDKIDETIHLVVAADDTPVCFAERQSSHRLRFYADVGMRLPWHAGSASKLLLAHLPPERQASILDGKNLEAYTPNTITDPKSLYTEFSHILANGYATSKGEMTIGARAAAAPIRDQTGHVVAAVSVVGLAERLSDSLMDQIVAWLIDGAQRISARLGNNQVSAGSSLAAKESIPTLTGR